MCQASVQAMSDHGVPYRVSVTVRHGVRKQIGTSHGSNLSARDLIGELPMVALSPDLKGITFGLREFRAPAWQTLAGMVKTPLAEELGGAATAGTAPIPRQLVRPTRRPAV